MFPGDEDVGVKFGRTRLIIWTLVVVVLFGFLIFAASIVFYYRTGGH